ncbi:MAG: NAD(P)/FAD-dependent oxidoreductase [Gammaproteobacteria bacterium]|jgi:kynurenine 3-monooxygenase
MTARKQRNEVTIVGAGLGGALMALYLARRGYQVRMFEKRPDMRKEDISAGRSINLALANRGLAALSEVGLEIEARALLTTMRGRMVHDLDGATNLQPYGQRNWEVVYSVSRGGLNALLMDRAEEAGVKIHFETPCTEVDLERRLLRFHDQVANVHIEAPMSPAIGADGAGSVMRQALLERPGYTCTVDMLDHDYKELNIRPTADGDFSMEPHALHIWPRGGYMLIALPNLDHSFTVTLFLPKTGNPDKAIGDEPGFDLLREPAEARAFFDAVFPDASVLIPDLERDWLHNPTGELGTVRCAPWHLDDRLALLGDAAHAIVPFHGQGMNCAFEDCLEMDRCLDETGGDWTRTLALYNERRKANADAIADMALENYIEMRASVADPKFVLRKQLAFNLERRYPDRFVPRYAMVMFRDDIGYAEARRRGKIQTDIINRATEGREDLYGLDYGAIGAEIEERLEPIGG